MNETPNLKTTLKFILSSTSRYYLFIVSFALFLIIFWQAPNTVYLETSLTLIKYLRLNFFIIYFIIMIIYQLLFFDRVANRLIEYLHANGLSTEKYLIILNVFIYIILSPFLISYWVFHYINWKMVIINLRIVPMIIVNLIIIQHFIFLLVLFFSIFKSSILQIFVFSIYILYQYFGGYIPHYILPLFSMRLQEMIVIEVIQGYYSNIWLGILSTLILGVIVWSRRSSLRF